MPRRGRAGVAAGLPRLVTLASDVGAAYAAQMKAVLARSVESGRLVDLAHDLRPHDVLEGAFLVRAMASGFPAGTVHLVVVDPGVGGRRAPLAIRCADGSMLVGPDNGVLMLLAEALGRPSAYRIDPARVGARPRVGRTFDGRDLFAPAAAALANGTAPEELGRPVVPRAAPELPARRTPRGARGVVVHIDRFGNVITSLPAAWVPRSTLRVGVAVHRAVRRLPWVDRYEVVPVGGLAALGSSFGTVELAANRASAAERLRVTVGSPVRLTW